MKFKVDNRTVVGAFFVALTFSDTIKTATSWMYPLIMLSILIVFYIINLMSGYGIKRGSYILKKYFLMGVIPYILIFMYSVLMITINHQGSRFINRSLGSSLIAIMTVITSASLVYIFKNKAADILCCGLVLNYAIHIILNLYKIGVGGLVEHIIDPLSTYENIFELHSVGFTLNLLLIYYLARKNKEDIGKIIVISVALYLIMKRIAFVGLIIALLVWFFTDVILKRSSNKKYIVIMWGLAIGAFCYVVFICKYPELFKALMIRLGILNRYLIADSFSSYNTLRKTIIKLKKRV